MRNEYERLICDCSEGVQDWQCWICGRDPVHFCRSTPIESQHLRRRHRLKSLRYLLLPPEPRLAVNLRRRLQSRAKSAVVQKHSAKDDCVGAESLLVVVYVRGAVLAVVLCISLAPRVVCREFGGTYAVHALARIALVRVVAQVIALCNLQCALGDDLVERVGAAGEIFAGVAMAVHE